MATPFPTPRLPPVTRQHLLHEEEFVVSDYRADPVSQAYKNFFDSEHTRTCNGSVMPRP